MTVSHGGARLISSVVTLVFVPLIHGGVPWILGVSGTHWGWASPKLPGMANYAGVLLVVVAISLLVWILVATLGEIHRLPERVPLGLRPAGLLQTGPYAWMGHPLYVAEMLLWLGVGIYLGSLVVLAVLSVAAVVVAAIVIPREEEALERYFGDEYRAYRSRLPFF